MLPRYEAACYLGIVSGAMTLIGSILLMFGYLALSRFSAALMLRLQNNKIGTPLLVELFVRGARAVVVFGALVILLSAATACGGVLLMVWNGQLWFGP